MAVAWVLFPAVMLAVCVGCGLAVERIGGWELPGSLLPAIGFATLIVLATLMTDHRRTAPLTTATIVIVALAGYAVSLPRLRKLRPDPWTLAVALGVFAICAAPVVLSGQASFLGYFIDNDQANHFSLVSQLLSHGHDLSALPSSTYSTILHAYIDTSYPPGLDVGLGALRPLVGQETAWVAQPYLAVVMALVGVVVDELLSGIVPGRSMRAACAFVVAQPGLVYAFYLEGSGKEIATNLVVVLAVWLCFATLARLRVRAVVPLLVVTVAGFDLLEVAIAPWLGLPLTVFVLGAVWRLRHAARRASRARMIAVSAGAAALLAALIVPVIGKASNFFNVANAVLTSKSELGNLAMPLSKWQALGIWPVDDFRFRITVHQWLAYALMGVALVGVALGATWLLRKRAWPLLVLGAGNGIAAAYLLSRTSPYASAKVLMIASLTVVLAATLGGAALSSAGRRWEGWALIAAIAVGVLWTNAVAAQHASVAPRDRLTELASIDHRFSGQGPAFFNLSDEYAYYFLRDTAPSLPLITSPTAQGAALSRSEFQNHRLPWDIDDLALRYVEQFKLLILARSPRFSRPPANYHLAFEGHFYDVWQRAAEPVVLRHQPLGNEADPTATPPCRLIKALAGDAARLHARVAFAPRQPLPELVPTRSNTPADWGVIAGDPLELIPGGVGGAVTGTIRVPRTGRYQVWLDGSFGQRFYVRIAGRLVGSVANELAPFGQAVLVADTTLQGGTQPVLIQRAAGFVATNSDGTSPTNRLLGPLMLVLDGTAETVTVVRPSLAPSLCGRSFDWVELVR